MTGLLEGKTAVVYGAAGGVGRSVANAFAWEGAMVFLAGRTLGSLKEVAGEIAKRGGKAEIAQVDALNPQSVQEHLQDIVSKSGKLDVSFNLISTSVGMGKALTELTDGQFGTVMFTLVKTHFITATAEKDAIVAEVKQVKSEVDAMRYLQKSRNMFH